MSLLVLGLYGLPYVLQAGVLHSLLLVNDWAAALAAVTLIMSVVAYLWAPHRAIVPSAFVIYLFLVATTAALIVTTAGASSAFLALWMVVAVFASIFGAWGTVSLLLLVIFGIGYYYLHQTPIGNLVTLGIAGIAPLVGSLIIFHTKPKKEGVGDRAYHELANELSQVSNKSEVVIKAIDDGVIALNSKGVIELINPAAQRIVGWGKGDALGLDYKSVLKLRDNHDQLIDEASNPIANTIATNNEVHTDTLTLITEGGRKILLALMVSPLGQPGEGVIVVFRDITKERREEHEQAEFISTASHEMRTPVASIEGYLGLALNPNTATIDEKAREFIEKAHESAQHLGRLFQDLLDVSKADDGRLNNHPGVIDVTSFVGDVADGLRQKAADKGLRMLYKPQPEGESDDKLAERRLSPVYYANVDPDHLREVVSNLIENAIKYTPQGDVIIDVGGSEERVKISIKDSGIGIPTEDIPHLFQKFYRVDNTATREIGGTGLGLYLCRRLTEVMGGHIAVESEFKKGSTFTIDVPRLSRDAALRLLEQAANSSDETTTQIIPDRNGALPIDAAATSPVSFERPPLAHAITPPTPTPAATPAPASAPPLQQPLLPQPSTPSAPLQGPQPPQAAPTLQTIEQNPAIYTTPRPSRGISIPVRNQNNQNQT